MTSLTAVRANIKLGSIDLEVFQLSNGEYRLSYTQALMTINVAENWLRTVPKKAPKVLEWLQSNGFRGVPLEIKVKETTARKVKLLTIEDVGLIWVHHASIGNEFAKTLVAACTIESIERRADAAFGKQRTEEERNERLEARVKGIVTRRTWTDSIRDYMTNNPVSDSYRQWVWINVSDKLNLAVFGKKAKQLRTERGVETDEQLRDTHDKESLTKIDRIEAHAMKLVDKLSYEPKTAMDEAIAFWL